MITTLLTFALYQTQLDPLVRPPLISPFYSRMPSEDDLVTFVFRVKGGMETEQKSIVSLAGDPFERHVSWHPIRIISSSIALGEEYHFLIGAEHPGIGVGKLRQEETYFGIGHVSKNDRVQMPTSSFYVEVDEPTIFPHQVIKIDPSQAIHNENPHLGVLYTYINVALQSSNQDAKQILQTLHAKAPLPYEKTRRKDDRKDRPNPIEGPALYIFNKAKTAPPIKKLMLLEILHEWNMYGYQEEFINAFKLVKNDPEVFNYINIKKIRIVDPYEKYFKLPSERAFELADSTELAEWKHLFLRNLPWFTANEQEKQKMASYLLVEDDRLQGLVIAWLANANRQPDKKLQPGLTPQERLAAIEALRVYWMTYYNIPPTTQQ